jgi:hypothetical protein
MLTMPLSALSARTVIDADCSTVVVTEIEFGKGAVQMLLTAKKRVPAKRDQITSE